MSDSPFMKDVTAADFDAQVIEGSRRQPVLVDFWAAWCGPCQMLTPMLGKLAKEYAGAFVVAKVNSDEQQELAARYGIRSLPTVKVFKNGQVVDEFMGVQPEATIRQMIERHVVKESDLVREQALAAYAKDDVEQAMDLLKTAVEMDPKQFAARIDLAKLLANQGDFAEANRLLDSLPPEVSETKEALELKAQLRFAAVVANAPDEQTLERELAASPDDPRIRYQLAARKLVSGEYEEALEHMLTLMLRHRDFEDDAGRQGMLAIFDVLGGEHPLVKRYRSRMFAALH
jgi:putative thioredoxin